MSQFAENLAISPGLARALEWIEQTAARAHCELILDSGTLLGLAREGTLLAGDLDIDVSLIDASAIERIVPILKHAGAEIWSYGALPYRAELPADRIGQALAVEVKFFRRENGFYVCPAVGFASPGGEGKTKRRGLRALMRPLWRRLLADGDAARFPMKHLARVDFWRLPATYFDARAALPDRPHCMVPKDVGGYLTYRYGEWRKPADDWIAWRDDGAYHATSARMRALQQSSPHRRT